MHYNTLVGPLKKAQDEAHFDWEAKRKGGFLNLNDIWVNHGRVVGATDFEFSVAFYI